MEIFDVLYKIVFLRCGWRNTERGDLFPVKIHPVVRKLHHIMIKFGFICVSVLSKDIGVMFDHTFPNLQITKSDITWAVSLVIAYGHFSLHQVFVWVCIATGDILTLSSTRSMIKLSDIIQKLKLQRNPFCSLWLYIPLLSCHCTSSTQDAWNTCVCNIYTLLV